MYSLRISSRENKLIVRKTGGYTLRVSSQSKTIKVSQVKPVIRVVSSKSIISVRKVNRIVKVNARAKRGLQGEPGVDGKVQELIAGPGIIIDNTDTAKPVISATGGSGDKNFVYDFTMQHTLNISHGLQKYPSATVINSAGDKVESTIKYVDINNVIVQFTAPFSGRVTLN